MVRLYTTYYNDKDSKRSSELDYCLYQNTQIEIDHITVFVEKEIKPHFEEFLLKQGNVKIIKQDTRTSFNQVFDEIRNDSKYASNYDLFITCNTDIFLHQKAQFVNYFTEKNDDSKKIALALSRWDYDFGSEKHFDRADSQDTWVFNGVTDIKLPIQINYGIAGCDNRLAYELQQNGYEVLNPSKRIKTIHYHTSNVRNYIVSGRVTERVDQPYLLIPPTY